MPLNVNMDILSLEPIKDMTKNLKAPQIIILHIVHHPNQTHTHTHTLTFKPTIFSKPPSTILTSNFHREKQEHTNYTT
jgi:hypothetical protein